MEIAAWALVTVSTLQVLKMLKKLLFLTLLFIAGSAYCITAEEVKNITMSETDSRVETLAKAMLKADDKTQAFLQALSDGAVKIADDKVLVLKGDKAFDVDEHGVRSWDTATAAHIDHVRTGIGQPTVWGDLKSQLYLGDADFADRLQQQARSKLGHTEIPRVPRRASAPPLAHFVALLERNSAMTQAYTTGCYSLKEIGQAFGLHYATVSRLVRAAEISRFTEGSLI